MHPFSSVHYSYGPWFMSESVFAQYLENEWILTKFCICIDIDIYPGIVKCQFLSIHYRVTALD